MHYIFLDESGCLGFDFSKRKTSKYFVISFLCVEGKYKRSLEKTVKKIYKSFPKKILRRHSGCLHCNKEKPKTRIKLLNMLKEKDVSIMAIYLDKRKVYSRLQDEKQILYNYVANILLDRVFSKKLITCTHKNTEIQLIASRRETNKFLNDNFKLYLSQQINKNHNMKIDVVIKPPHAEKCLQIVDFVCWSMFRKFEHKDAFYSNIIKNLVLEENSLFG